MQLEKKKKEVEVLISKYRKKGHDTYIAECLNSLVKSHIQMCNATKDFHDYKLLAQLFFEITKEVENSTIIELLSY